MVIGITGGFGTGKSTVREELRRCGAAVLDADAVYHQLIRPGAVGWRKLVKAFGRGILREDRKIDRQTLSKLVFGHPARRKLLERLTHPLVRRELDRKIGLFLHRSPRRLVAVEIPLLVEAHAFRHVDGVLLVTVNRARQMARLRKKFPSLTDRAIARVLASQMPLKTKRRFADWVVDNGGSKAATRTQVRRLFHELVNIKTGIN